MRNPGRRMCNPRGTECTIRSAETLGIEIRNREHRIRNPQAWNAQCTETSRVRVSVKTRKQRRVTTTHSSRGVPDARYVDAMRSFHTDS
jgi:hypothetical protein